MILKNLMALSKTNPSELIRLRDSVYSTDLLITAIGHLNFFSRIGLNPASFEEIISTFKIDPRATDVMLTLFKAQGLITEKNNIFELTELAQEHLTDLSDWNLIPYFSTQTERPIVEKMLQVLKTGQPATWGGKKDELDWAKAMEKDEFADMFTAGMDSRGAYFAPGLANSFDFSKYNSIIDIAGASGIYAAAIKTKFPKIRAALLEKPPVNKIAETALSKRGLEKDIEVFAADMFTDVFPIGFDIHLYSHVLHDWDFEQNKRLIKDSFQTLNSGGLIMIHDAHINEDKTGPLSVAEYSVLLMFSTHGKCYSISELKELLTGEGFKDIEFQETVGNRSIVTGKKP
jgi:predicted O-methyltransferase YrrM